MPYDGQSLGHQQSREIIAPRRLDEGPNGRIAAIGIHWLPARINGERLVQLVPCERARQVSRSQRQSLALLIQPKIAGLHGTARTRVEVPFHTVDEVESKDVMLAVSQNLDAVAVTV